MHVSHGRGLLCVLTLIGPLFKIFLGEEVMKILDPGWQLKTVSLEPAIV